VKGSFCTDSVIYFSFYWWEVQPFFGGGATTWRWILKRISDKMDSVFVNFSLQETQYYSEYDRKHKIAEYFHLSSESSFVTSSLYGTYLSYSSPFCDLAIAKSTFK
jgi:hypothetical protein